MLGARGAHRREYTSRCANRNCRPHAYLAYICQRHVQRAKGGGGRKRGNRIIEALLLPTDASPGTECAAAVHFPSYM
jgi:hypothetical protein